MKERDILKIYNNYCIIGMSPDSEKYSYQIYQCLKNAGKHVYGISPKYDTIDNDKMYTSLLDIQYPVDVVVFYRQESNWYGLYKRYEGAGY